MQNEDITPTHTHRERERERERERDTCWSPGDDDNLNPSVDIVYHSSALLGGDLVKLFYE